VEGAAGVSDLGAIVHHRRHDEAVLSVRPRTANSWNSIGREASLPLVGPSVTASLPGRHGKDAAKRQWINLA
jgi:hypothetical protein